MTSDEEILDLTRKIDRTTVEVDQLRATLFRLEEEAIATRTAVIESELKNIKKDVELIPALADEVVKMRAGLQTARWIAGAIGLFVIPISSWLYSTTIDALRIEMEAQRKLIETHLTSDDHGK